MILNTKNLFNLISTCIVTNPISSIVSIRCYKDRNKSVVTILNLSYVQSLNFHGPFQPLFYPYFALCIALFFGNKAFYVFLINLHLR